MRDAKLADLPAIVAIYNQSVPGGWSTADTRPVSVDDRRAWFERHDPARRPLWVAETEREVVAWVGLSSFYQGRPAYDATAEISTYVATSHQRRGIGRFLKERMIAHCPNLGVTTLLSMYFDHNQATRRINDTLGFETMGHLTSIAVVDGMPRGLIIAGLRIPPNVPNDSHVACST
ncbi:N-acetyltransferase family protein [Kolteria novifilia]|uniref:GNAT family N-acetyltransferase n=1 Tax=Kolteria novifilia TaxID=2527975 RepID=UPI003AF3A4FB